MVYQFEFISFSQIFLLFSSFSGSDIAFRMARCFFRISFLSGKLFLVSIFFPKVCDGTVRILHVNIV